MVVNRKIHLRKSVLGFDKKQKTDEKKPHKKDRLRDKKNKGKPDFAAKRAKKAAALKAKEQV